MKLDIDYLPTPQIVDEHDSQSQPISKPVADKSDADHSITETVIDRSKMDQPVSEPMTNNSDGDQSIANPALNGSRIDPPVTESVTDTSNTDQPVKESTPDTVYSINSSSSEGVIKIKAVQNGEQTAQSGDVDEKKLR